MHRQLYQAVRDGILSSLLPAGLQLPSSRQLALELSISRNTVIGAYEQLLAEGFLEAEIGSGTFIADTTPTMGTRASRHKERTTRNTGRSELSPRGEELIRHAGASALHYGPFMPGIPDISLFPSLIWNRLQSRHWRRPGAQLLTYGAGAGYLPLREAIANHIRVSRLVNCTPEQVLITTGTHQSVDLILRMLGQPGDRAWIEDPCYWGTRSVLKSHEIKPVAIPVDEEGMQIRSANAKIAPKFVFITPSHQYPLGPVMSLSRRRMLLEHAAVHHTWIIEDDYDGEFRYNGRTLASLQSMDAHERVLYLGTFSKTLFPALRIGFLVVPKSLASPLAAGISELDRGGPEFLQAVLADFINEGYFSSHVRRMKVVYAERMDLLRKAIHHYFGEQVQISCSDAGLHLTLMLPDACNDVSISNAARQVGILVRPLSSYYMCRQRKRNGLVLGYACVRDEHISSTFVTLATIIKKNCRLYED